VGGFNIPVRRLVRVSMRHIAVIVAVVSLLVVPNVLAKPYAHSGRHFRLVVPDSWTRVGIPGVDGAFVSSPDPEGFSAALLVVSSPLPEARESEPWILEFAVIGHNAILGNVTLLQENLTRAESPINITDVFSIQPPRSFTTTSGLPAADFVMGVIVELTTRIPVQSATFQIRQVLFASDVWDRVYLLEFGAKQTDYPAHEEEWRAAVDSFWIDSGPNYLLTLGVAAPAFALLGVAFYGRYRGRRGSGRGTIPPGPIAPGGPTLPDSATMDSETSTPSPPSAR